MREEVWVSCVGLAVPAVFDVIFPLAAGTACPTNPKHPKNFSPPSFASLPLRVFVFHPKARTNVAASLTFFKVPQKNRNPRKLKT